MGKYKLQNMSFYCFLALITILICLLEGCTINYNYHCIENYEKNPTSYVFNKNVDTIRQLLIENDYKIQKVFCKYYKESLKSNEIYVDDLDTTTYCSSGFYFIPLEEKDTIGIESGTNNALIFFKFNGFDIYLESNGSFHSEVCINDNGEPLHMSSNFLIHFEIIDSIRTKIKVSAILPEINTAICKFGAPGFQDYPIDSPTEPTTIEEYQILLKIGEILGVKKEMPKCKYPDLKKPKQ